MLLLVVKGFLGGEWGVGRTGMGHTDAVGRLLLGHSLGGCSGGETADRYEDVPAGWRVSAGYRGQAHRPERFSRGGGCGGRPRGRCSA